MRDDKRNNGRVRIGGGKSAEEENKQETSSHFLIPSICSSVHIFKKIYFLNLLFVPWCLCGFTFLVCTEKKNSNTRFTEQNWH